jgi:hypothetical protein
MPRPAGSGKPKGYKAPQTLTKLAARDFLRDKVIAAMEPMIAAQIASALGISFLMVREKTTGKFLRVGKGAAEKLNPDEEIVEVWEKEPSVQAFTDLMNRALDKPKEQEIEVAHSGGITIKHELPE